MKKTVITSLMILISINISLSQNTNYDKLWETIDAQLQNRLPRKAQETLDIIEKSAILEKNQPQLIKSAIYRYEILSQYEENSLLKSITLIEEKLKVSESPVKNIYYSILGKLYSYYYQSNKWEISERTNVNNTSDDISTWSRQDFMNKCYDYYLKSVSDKDLLMSIDLNDYKDILQQKENKSRRYRPTLYNFLAFEAIDFIKDSENNPLGYTILNDKAFVSFHEFINLNIDDSFSNSQNIIDVLKLYQDLLKSSLDKADAFIHTELLRLEYVYNNIYTDNKDDLYLNALFNLERRYAQHPDIADIMYSIASFYSKRGNDIDTETEDIIKGQDFENDNYYKAIQYCNQAYKQHPDTDGGKKCYNLMQKIMEKDISNISYQEIIYPGEHFPVKVSYKNCDNLYYKIIKISSDEYINLLYNFHSTDIIKKYSNKSYVESGQITLPEKEDYRYHTTQLIMPKLQNGFYFLLLSNDESFNINKGNVAIERINVCDIQTILTFNSRNEAEIITCDRNTGNPIPECNIEIFNINRSRNNRSNVKLKLSSDENGKVKFNRTILQNSYNLYVKISNNKDSELIESLRIYNEYGRSDYEQVMLFTDRSVYRPGQIVYFKGIACETNGTIHKVKNNQKITVTFRDANYTTVSEKTFTTNEYGSFTGEFTIPTNILTGEFSITTKKGNIHFRVEEYKRPTFKIDFETTTQQLRTNQDICVKIKPTTYTGLPLENVKVKYSISRNSYNHRYWYIPFGNSVSIVSGTTETNEEGIAEICFKAVCPQNKPWYTNTPIYAFDITVDITDISGETNTETYTIRVSDVSLVINSNIKSEINLSKVTKNDSLKIETSNINGYKIDVPVNIKIVKLKTPETIKRPPLWGNNSDIDLNIYTEKEFNDKLPIDVYSKEMLYETWEKDNTIFNETNIENTIAINSLKLEPGCYMIELSAKDNTGKEISEKYYTNVYNNNTYPVFNEGGIKIEVDKLIAEPSDKVEINIYSSKKNCFAKVFIGSKDRVIFDDYITIDNNSKTLSINVQEKDRGKIYINVLSCFDNRQYSEKQTISVPFKNRELDIKLITTRTDAGTKSGMKLTPGKKENWSLEILNQGKGTSSEVLVFMYDKSLEKITSSNFIFTDYPNRYFIYNYIKSPFIINNSLVSVYGITHKTQPILKVDDIDFDRFILLDRSLIYFRNNTLKGYRGGGFPGDGVIYEAQSLGVNDHISNADESLKMKEDVAEDMIVDETDEHKQENKSNDIEIQPLRTDFRETAFFYPQLSSDEKGTLTFEFTVPDAITEWQMYALAHKKDMSMGMIEQSFISKKDLFIQANRPKVLYEGDKIDFSARISNLSDKDLYADAFIEVYDIYDNKINISELITPVEPIYIAKGENAYVKWNIQVPDKNISLLKIRVGASSEQHTDIEEFLIPVLTTKVLITETLPLTLNEKGKHTFTFNRYKQYNNNPKYETKSLSLEYTPNPIWNAILSLPYTTIDDDKFPNDVFNALYSNIIAKNIIEHNPSIKDIYNKIKATNPDEFMSQLEKNPELKNILLNETPWVADARNEKEQKELLAILFDINKTQIDKRNNLLKLKGLQYSNGGFPWIDGSNYASFYVTLNILEGFVHLQKLGTLNIEKEYDIKAIISAGENYLDNEVIKYYNDIKEHDYNIVSNSILRYLYFKSELHKGFSDINNSTLKNAIDYFMTSLEKNWNKYDLISQSLATLVFNNTGKNNLTRLLMESFEERALYSDELGKYWRDLNPDRNYGSSIYGLTKLIECYYFVNKDSKATGQIQRYLLNLKRTTMWRTGSATAEAIYALLLNNNNKFIVDTDSKDNITIGNDKIDTDLSIPGSGYIKKTWIGKEAKSNYSEVTIEKDKEGTSWGSIYWQYLTDYENVTQSGDNLKVTRQLFRSDFKGNEKTFSEIKEGDIVSKTDKIVVRMIIDIDRDMQFVHIKDILPGCFIPEEVTSGFRHNGSMWYYKSIKDESVNFFVENLVKGRYVLEYNINIQQSGIFTAGLTKIQCMYAPEFSGQSEGSKIIIK